MLGAAACYALSSFVVKRYRDLSSVGVSFISITVGAVLTLPIALATLPSELPGLRASLAVLALGVVGTALAFVIFYKLIAETGAARAALVSYLAPGVALIYGALLLDEQITVASVVGLALILGGVALASRQRRAVASRGDGSDPLAAGDGVPRPGARLARAQPSRADA
jgi:drug/metabolite transporter (DMT)-like permease